MYRADLDNSYASILKWMSFFNSEVLPPLGGWLRPILGRDPYNKKNVDDSSKAALKAVGVVRITSLSQYYLDIQLTLRRLRSTCFTTPTWLVSVSLLRICSLLASSLAVSNTSSIRSGGLRTQMYVFSPFSSRTALPE